MSPAIEDRNPGQAANVVEPPGSIYSEKSIITLRKEQKLEGLVWWGSPRIGGMHPRLKLVKTLVLQQTICRGQALMSPRPKRDESRGYGLLSQKSKSSETRRLFFLWGRMGSTHISLVFLLGGPPYLRSSGIPA